MDSVSDYNFSYPPELVAQYPSTQRGQSRLMVCHRATQEIHHTTFPHILDFLDAGDCLVFNDTRVRAARFLGKKETGGAVEVFILSELSDHGWTCMVKGVRRNQKTCKIIFTHDLYGILQEYNGDIWKINFQSKNNLSELLNQYGHMPLPPYIERPDEIVDRERYQTVFARQEGAVAAPTAGLHWTEDLSTKVKQKNIGIAFITLHVGIGTFLPIRSENIADHKMHSEYVEISNEAVQKITKAKRVVAVGTTVVRALESAMQSFACGKEEVFWSEVERRPFGPSHERKKTSSFPQPQDSFWTDLFIRPGYRFKVVNALQTNFHQPKSSLLVMVSAFAGREFMQKCYAEAITQKYRLFSYGDTMLIL